jgi:hypothetical protein
MDKQDHSREAELKRPSEATKDLQPNEQETEQVKGGAVDCFDRDPGL